MELIGAIDQGTTSTRFFLYDRHHKVVASHQMEFEQIHPQAGWVEHDPLTILHTVRECMHAAVSQAASLVTKAAPDTGGRPQSGADIEPGALQVRAVGLTNQRETTVLWRRSTGQPLYNAIVWMDTRTSAICQQLEQELPLGREEWRAITGLPISTYFSAVKLLWLLHEVPAVREAVDDGDAMFGTVESWILWNMTGGAAHPDTAVHVTDCTNASRTLLMDLRTLTWHAAILEKLGIPASILPRIIGNADVIGRIAPGWPLPGVPLAGCLGDQHAAVLGQRCAVGEAKATYGTGCFILMPTGSEPCTSSHGLLSTLAHCLTPSPSSCPSLSHQGGASGKEEPGKQLTKGEQLVQGQEGSALPISASPSQWPPAGSVVYALEGSIAIAGAAVQWLRDSLGVIQSAAEVQTLAQSVENTGGVYFVPAFSGLFAPRWREDARGVLLGISRYTTKAHVARAVLEAMAFQAREVVHAMQSDAASTLPSAADSSVSGEEGSSSASPPGFVLRVDGGAAVNDLLLQIQADILGCPVLRPPSIETTALGAAIAAGLAVGFWTHNEVLGHDECDSGEGSRDPVMKGGTKFKPAIAESERERRFASWCKAVERSYDLADLG